MFGTKPAFGTPSTFGTTTGGFGSTGFGAQSQSSSLFGASKPAVSFGQPAGSTGLFGTTTTASSTFGGTSSLFGQPSTSTTAFGATNPAGPFFGSTTGTTNAFQPNTSLSSGGFGFGTTTGSLFSGSTVQQPTSGMFSVQTGGGTLFGTGTQQIGSTIKFNALLGTDQMMKNSLQQTVQTRHQCISAMKEYESKSLEELRTEDYAANRKGPQQGMFAAQPQASASLFGAPATTASALSLFGSTAKSFAAPSFGGTNTFGSTSTNFSQPGGSLFGVGQQQQQQTSLFGTSKPTVSFGQSVAQPSQGLFGVTTTTGANTFGTGASNFAFGTQPTTGTFGTTGGTLFGQPAPNQSLFGAAGFPASVPQQTGFTGFGTSSGLFSTATQPVASTGSLFGNQLGSGSTNLFGSAGQSNGLKLGTAPVAQQKSAFGTSPFGQPSGFAQPFGTTSGLFGTSNAGAFGTTSVLGNQTKPPTFNYFGSSNTPAFGSGLSSNMPVQNIGLGSDASFLMQSSMLQAQLAGLANSPYGDGALLKLLRGKRDGIPSPTDPVYQKQLLNTSSSPLSASFNAKPLPPARPSPRILTLNAGLNVSGTTREKKSLFDDLESDTVVFKEGFIPKRNVKKLVIDRMKPKAEKRQSPSALMTQRSLSSYSNEDSPGIQAHLDSVARNRETIAQPLTFDSPSITRQTTEDTSLSNVSQSFYEDREIHDNLVTPVVRPLTRKPISRESVNFDSSSPSANINESYANIVSVNEGSNDTGAVEKRVNSVEIVTTYDNSFDRQKQKEKTNVTTFVATLSGIEYLKNDVSMKQSEDLDSSTDGFYSHVTGIVCQRPDYYTVPTLDELAALVDDRGRCIVDGFTVGKTNVGSIFWPDTFNVGNLNLDQLVFFQHKEVTVYPDDADKPPVGYGLNRRAEITLEQVWPNDKTTHLPIKDPKRLEMMHYAERLERAATKMNAKFLSYDPETGSWVFQVPHFSKYGLGEDHDEEDDDSLIDDESMRINKKIFLFSSISSPPLITDHVKPVQMDSIATPSQITKPKNNVVVLPYEKSLVFGRERFYLDSSLYNNRRFRVGWSFVKTFVAKGCPYNKTDKELPSRMSIFRNVSRLDMVHSQEFSLSIQEPVETSEESLNLVQCLLATQLKCSEITDSSSCPSFVFVRGVNSIVEYIAALSSEIIEKTKESSFILQVFRLCYSLWGDLQDSCNNHYKTDKSRKNNLTDWLCEMTKERTDIEVKNVKEKGGKDNVAELIFILLSNRRLSEAAQLAFDNGDFHLAFLIGQLGGCEKVKTFFRQQLLQWYESQADCFIDHSRLKLFCLLAGLLGWECSSKQLVNLSANLDWYRCFGLHMWYSCHSFCTVPDALKAYDSNWSNLATPKTSTTPPYPFYVPQNDQLKPQFLDKEDICYQLIKLFCDPNLNLESVLNTATWTSDPLVFHTSWHMFCVLSALGFGNISIQRKFQLHLEYASQLERSGLWHWAVFVLMHIEDDKVREAAIKRLISRYAPFAEEEHIDFVKNELKVPVSWIFEAKALKAHNNGDKCEEAWYELKAENWNVAHTLFIQIAGPSAIRDEDYKTLNSFLSELSSHSDEIQNWSVGGQIYSDYVKLISNYDSLKTRADVISDNDISNLCPLVMSVAVRLKSLESLTPLQKLCQSEMAFRVANLLRLVLSEEKYLEYSQVVADLPMPDDYLLEELQHIVDVAIKAYDKTYTQK